MMKNPFISLKSRDFRIYWLGLGASQTGTWMQNIAQPWLALKVTNDPALVGLVSAMHFLPIMIFSLFSGVLVDRANKRRILFFTQAGLCAVSLGFALSVYMDFASFGVILALAFLTGLFNSLDSPTRHSFIYELVSDKAIIANAVALNAMSVSVSRILGPALAGIIMAGFGIGACFLFNTLSFVAIFASLFLVRPTPTRRDSSRAGVIKSIIKGFIYIKAHDKLLSPLIVLLIIATFIPNYSVTVSALAQFSLGGSDKDYGYLMAFLGFGAFCGAFFVASISSHISYKIVLFMPLVAAFSLSCVGAWGDFWLCGISLSLTSCCFLITISTINSLLQLGTDDKYRGRVMSVYSLFFLGSTPIGAAFAGLITKHFGADAAFLISGVLVYISLALWYLYLRLRRA